MTAGRVERLAIRAGRMFDGSRFHDGPVTVVVEDGLIGAVESPGNGCPPGTALVDLGGAALLPGLIDAHTHLCWDPDGDPEDLAGAAHDALVDRARRHAAAALGAGITTVRDLGDRDFATLTLREEYRRGAQVGPELLVSGPPLTRRGGHCWYLGGEAEDTGALVAAVRERAERGTDWVKIMATGGFMTAGTDPCRPQYSADELAAVVDAAHRAGLPVTAHAHATAGIAAAIAAGVDGIEHCTFLTESGVAASPEVVEAIVGRGVWCGITIGRALPEMPDDIKALMEGVWRNIRRLVDAGARVAHMVSGKMLDYIEMEDGFSIIKMHPPRDVQGFAISESRVRERFGVTIIGVKSPGHPFEYTKPSTHIGPEDIIIVSGDSELLEAFANR